MDDNVMPGIAIVVPHALHRVEEEVKGQLMANEAGTGAGADSSVRITCRHGYSRSPVRKSRTERRPDRDLGNRS